MLCQYDVQFHRVKQPLHVTLSAMDSDGQILTRKQKNLLCAKRNYYQKKKDRQFLEKKNEELMTNQMLLLQDMSILQNKVTQVLTVLYQHSKNDSCSYKNSLGEAENNDNNARYLHNGKLNSQHQHHYTIYADNK